MSIGDGLSTEAIEQNPDVAQLQARQFGQGRFLPFLPDTGFVESINALNGLLTIQAGSSSTGVTVVVTTDGVSTISIGVTGIGGLGIAKTTIAAGPPTVADDSGAGYARFSQWIDTTGPTAYICLDPALGAAIWEPFGIDADIGWTNITGTPSKVGYDTATATVTQLAETVMAMQQALLTAGVLAP